jgi:hypothetical protein
VTGDIGMYCDRSGPDPSAVYAAEKETGSLTKVKSTSGAGKSDEWE